MDSVVYVCTGGCGAVISQEQFEQGLTSCGTDGCLHHGKQFEKRIKCDECGQLHKEDEPHAH